jgi:hypothetical protein
MPANVPELKYVETERNVENDSYMDFQSYPDHAVHTYFW